MLLWSDGPLISFFASDRYLIGSCADTTGMVHNESQHVCSFNLCVCVYLIAYLCVNKPLIDSGEFRTKDKIIVLIQTTLQA